MNNFLLRSENKSLMVILGLSKAISYQHEAGMVTAKRGLRILRSTKTGYYDHISNQGS